ncbi:MAG: DUF2484 family protein [Rhodobacter sp.]|nr:DUF2484 family protein [Rhodobacter sp.]MBK8441099.1 DUF2484 family protein [Rhodobacter sp.]
MTGPATAAVIWVLAATVTAFLPMRAQMLPGLALLAAAPVLIGWIGLSHGWLWALPAVLAFVSMFRNPLRYLIRRALGRPAPLPPEPAPQRDRTP